jgi:pimeloyl-ACP methyl ester carboxylesterase
VENAIESEEMDNIVLVVHSYAGMIGTAIADRMPNRLRHLVYVDAVVPKPGESWSSTQTSAMKEARMAAAASSPDFSFPPPDPSVYGLKNEAYEWVKRRQMPQPGHTYQEPLQFDPARVGTVPRTFIDCTQPPLSTIDIFRRRVRDSKFWDGAWKGGMGARVVELKTGHDAMVSEPQALSRILIECVGNVH